MRMWIAVAVSFLILRSHALSQSKPKPVRRVAIIGAGVAGLSTAHALVSLPSSSSSSSSSSSLSTSQHDISVSIFDARTGLDRGVGAGVQLNGGLSILGKINPVVQRAVLDAGSTLELVRSRAKPWNPEKSPEGYDTLLELPLRKIIEKAGGETKAALLPDGKLLWSSIMRGALQEALFDTLPDGTKSRIEFGKMLINIHPAQQEEGGVMCEFSDGSKAGPFDVIVGADGIKSAIKEYVDKGRISRDPKKREGAAAGIYSGLRIRYAVRDGDPSSTNDDPPVITQYFGDAAYCFSGVFGTGNGRPKTKCAFITFLDKDYIGPFPRKKIERMTSENADWTQDTRMSVENSRETMLKQLRDSNVPEVELLETITGADRFFELGVYAHNPFCRWSKEIPGSNGAFAVLAGDAAHALLPFLGQGANQAILDAYSLGTRIKQYNDQVTGEVTGEGDGEQDVTLLRYLRDYEKTRWPATFGIFLKSGFLGYLETGGFDGVYAKFRDLFFKTMGVLGIASYILLNAATPTV